ncbi:MAG: penicillin-binding protein 2 [Lentisphaeria bacterium]|nr:penicillin-binding protein 2 [Lentisphaeria bacterium]
MAILFNKVRLRIIVISCLWIPILGCFIWRAYHIQIQRNKELKAKATAKYSTEVKLSGKRGEIFDIDGNLLVSNLPKVTIAVSPYDSVHAAFFHYEKSNNKKKRAMADELREQRRRKLAVIFSQVFNKPVMYYYQELKPMTTTVKNGKTVVIKHQYLLLDREADRELADRLKKMLKSSKISTAAFRFKNIYVRNHPKGTLAADLLGYTDVVNDREVAKGGLESALNTRMKSTDGRHAYERGRRGHILSYGKQDFDAATDGKDVFLTIRENIQAILEEELDKCFAEWRPDNIYAAIADPRTGDVLALAQRPTWNPSDRTTFVKNQTGTRFASEIYEPGSVFKPFFVGKALDWGVVTPGERVNCERGTWIYAGKKLSDVGRYENLTIGEVLKKSSNIGSAKIGLKMGELRQNEVRRLFGFGQKTGLPFIRESKGNMLILPREKVAATRVPIGYGTNVTMLQLLRGYCAIATGKLPKLNIIDRYRDSESGREYLVQREEPTPVFENSQAHRQLVEMLCTVTAKDGTGKRAAIPGYEVAGKTGTARKHLPKLGYKGNKAYYTSFAGFVPAKRPELVMVITVDYPRGPGVGGGTVAAPVFKRTMERVLKVMLVPPDFPEDIKKP